MKNVAEARARWNETNNHMIDNPSDFVNDDRAEIVAEIVDANFKANDESWISLVDTAYEIVSESKRPGLVATVEAVARRLNLTRD